MTTINPYINFNGNAEEAFNFYKSWAIQKQPAQLEQKFWDARGVEIFDANLKDYVTELDQRIRSLPAAG